MKKWPTNIAADLATHSNSADFAVNATLGCDAVVVNQRPTKESSRFDALRADAHGESRWPTEEMTRAVSVSI